ncbi:VanW family protein [Aureibacter tunicatorum]|nr:VanW family protein [Aureibacter tunicatorum]BDD07191.1 hypothetical protein AUTU_46740 [Aureibacter tunicatorum]
MNIKKPERRSKIRKLIGKEYFIFKRKLKWWFGQEVLAQKMCGVDCSYPVFEHKSTIMRPLKNVEMYLQENKRTNLQLAIDKLDKVEIKPGEIFSFWKLVGKPTSRKGFKEGLVLENGNISKGIGGGLCQLGNLLYWIFAHSPLDVVERYRHGFDVFPDLNRKVPFGAGATLSYNYIDLQVQNNTEQSFQIELWLDEKYLRGKLLSNRKTIYDYQVEERDHCMKMQYWGGYSRHNKIFKLTLLSNEIVQEQLLTENHAIMMYNPFIESKA